MKSVSILYKKLLEIRANLLNCYINIYFVEDFLLNQLFFLCYFYNLAYLQLNIVSQYTVIIQISNWALINFLHVHLIEGELNRIIIVCMIQQIFSSYSLLDIYNLDLSTLIVIYILLQSFPQYLLNGVSGFFS